MRYIIPGLAIVGLIFLVMSGAISKGLDIVTNIIQAFQNAV